MQDSKGRAYEHCEYAVLYGSRRERILPGAPYKPSLLVLTAIRDSVSRGNSGKEGEWLVDFQTHFVNIRKMLLERGVMVDIEAAGPALNKHAMLSLGANRISDIESKFYVELRPDKFAFEPEALTITGFSLEALSKSGTEPRVAIRNFHDWISSLGIKKPLFVARAANFDWKFYDYYAWRYAGENPFGYTAFDTISAFGELYPNRDNPHHAGEDARIQTQDLQKFFTTF